MRKLLLFGSCLLMAVGCGQSDQSTSNASSASAEGATFTQSARVFDKALEKQPCSLLSAEMVSATVGVPVDQIEQRKVSSMCMYLWKGGNARVGFVRTFKSADIAATFFANAHKSMTGDEVKAAMKQIGEGAKEKIEEDGKAGKDVPDSELVEPLIGALAASLGGGFTFEAIEGIGDQAAFETTRTEAKILDRVYVSYANNLDVLIGNMSFDVGFALDDDESEAKMFKAENIALAKAVLEGL